MKTKFFLCLLCLAAVFGCDDSEKTAPMTRYYFIGIYGDLKFPANASDTLLTGEHSDWYVLFFDKPNIFYSIGSHPDDVLLTDNPEKRETLSYEWLTVSKTDNRLRLSIAENTSDTVRSIRICLRGDRDGISTMQIPDQFTFITQYPKEKD
jgi:hypothetical protein